MNEVSRTSLLLDTNIWIDYYAGARKNHRHAFELIDYTIKHDIDLLYMAGSIKDVFHILGETQKMEALLEEGRLTQGAASAINEIAWGCIDSMTSLAASVPLDLRTIWMAQRMKSTHADFEDCLVLASCELGVPDFLVTGDKQLLGKSPIATMDAADMLAYLKSR